MLVLPRPRPELSGSGRRLASRDGKTLYVALADARQLALLDVARGKVAATIALPAEPTALALSPDGTRLYVTCAAPGARSPSSIRHPARSSIRSRRGTWPTAWP